MIWVFLGTLAFAALVLIWKALEYIARAFGCSTPQAPCAPPEAEHWLKTNAEERDWLRSPKELL